MRAEITYVHNSKCDPITIHGEIFDMVGPMNLFYAIKGPFGKKSDWTLINKMHVSEIKVSDKDFDTFFLGNTDEIKDEIKMHRTRMAEQKRLMEQKPKPFDGGAFN